MWAALVLIVTVILVSNGWVAARPNGQTVTADASSRDDTGSSYDVYSFRTPTPIPDGDRRGVAVGPIRTPDDGGTVAGVMVSIQIMHPCTSDLAVRLSYDEDNDGLPEAAASLESYRARPGGWAVREPFACPAEMNGVYYYRDEPPGAVGGPIDAPFAVFDGLERGGSFTLTATDSLAPDEGTLVAWTVFLKRPVARTAPAGDAG
jgi:hypothetical protein